jgi:phosphatidylserine decarboxylase
MAATHETNDPAQHVPDVTPELPGVPWRVALALMHRLPQAALSRSFGALADTPVPRRLRRAVIGGFARLMGIDVTEAERPVTEYASVNEYFVRRLRPGVRDWPDDDATLAAPVDGVLGQHGTITRGRLIQAKGRDYGAAALLGDDDAAACFEGGSFLTIYLSPRHYHRIHAPCGGHVVSARHIPGALLPVNRAGVLHVRDLFPRNERVVCTIEGAVGAVAVVAVGAYNVGRISAAFDPDWVGPGRSVANRPGARADARRYDPPPFVRQGDELMAFHLGSTIVMLCEPGLTPCTAAPGAEVRLGEVLQRRSS